MKIRDMKMEDYDAVNALLQELHRLHISGRPDIYSPADHLYSREEFLQILECRQCIAIAAEEQGRIIGVCFTAIQKENTKHDRITAYMEDMYVSPEARRKGVATKLFRETEKRAAAQGAVCLNLMAWEFNQPALDFYKEMGMKTQRRILEKDWTL